MFSEKVSEYLNNGWVICPQSMSGHQGEIGKVDVVKGRELVRIWLDNESSYNWSDDTAWYGNIVVFRVSKWIQSVDRVLPDMTVWMSDLEHIEEYKFYEIFQWRGGWYVDSLEEALRIQNLRRVRYQATHNSIDRVHKRILTDDKSKTIAASYMKRNYGYKRLVWDKLSIHAHVASNLKTIYYVNYGDKKYELS